MKGHFSSKFRRFARNSEGATMIEFALIFPVMLLITFGIMEVSLYLVSQVTLEGGLKEASRFGITTESGGPLSATDLAKVPTAFKDDNDPRLEMIGLILNNHTLDMIDLNNADIKYTIYDSFSVIKDGEPYSDLPNVNGQAAANGQYDGPGTPGTPLIPAGQPGAGTPGGEPYSDMNCNGVRDGPGKKGDGIGGPGDIVVFNIKYNWRVLTPIIGKYIGTVDPQNANRYIIPMNATIVVKNEPNISGSAFCKAS